jgi:hypothetical protein
MIRFFGIRYAVIFTHNSNACKSPNRNTDAVKKFQKSLYTRSGFELMLFWSWGGRDVHCAMLPGLPYHLYLPMYMRQYYIKVYGLPILGK